MMTIHKIDIHAPLSEEDEKLLQEAMEEDVTYDEDCPPLTEKEIEMFKQIAFQKRKNRNKQTISIRLSPAAMQKARSLGKGYTAILSRMVESGLSDNELIRKFL